MSNLNEILSGLNILGATQNNTGGPYANYLVVLNSSGQIDSSLFSSSIAYYSVSSLSSISGPSLGALAVVNGTSTYICTDAVTPTWLLISQLNAGGISFTPASGLVSTNVQSAIAEVASNTISNSSNTAISGNVTFDTGGAPFIIGSSSTNVLVSGLNAEQLGGHSSSYYLNASNINAGTLGTSYLSGTYAISISGWAQNAYLANTASGLDVARLNTGVSSTSRLDPSLFSTTATYPISISGTAGSASSASLLNGEPGSYYLNPANLTGGYIPSSVFNASSHGSLAGGSLHSTAIPTGTSGAAAGFISANDQAKLNTVSDNAEPNQNAFSYINFGGGSNITASSPTSTFNILAGSSMLSITPNYSTSTITLDVSLGSLMHNSLGGLTVGDPHTQYLNISGSRVSTITTAPIFSTSGAPFTLSGSSIGYLVTGLNAEQLNGHPYSDFTSATYLTSGTLPTGRLSGTYDISISGSAALSLPLTGGTVTGAVSVNGLTDSALAGSGTKAIGVNNSGLISTSVTTDNLTQGSTNLYLTGSNLDTLLSSHTLGEVVTSSVTPTHTQTTAFATVGYVNALIISNGGHVP